MCWESVHVLKLLITCVSCRQCFPRAMQILMQLAGTILYALNAAVLYDFFLLFHTIIIIIIIIISGSFVRHYSVRVNCVPYIKLVHYCGPLLSETGESPVFKPMPRL